MRKQKPGDHDFRALNRPYFLVHHPTSSSHTVPDSLVPERPYPSLSAKSNPVPNPGSPFRFKAVITTTYHYLWLAHRPPDPVVSSGILSTSVLSPPALALASPLSELWLLSLWHDFDVSVLKNSFLVILQEGVRTSCPVFGQ